MEERLAERGERKAEAPGHDEGGRGEPLFHDTVPEPPCVEEEKASEREREYDDVALDRGEQYPEHEKGLQEGSRPVAHESPAHYDHREQGRSNDKALRVDVQEYAQRPYEEGLEVYEVPYVVDVGRPLCLYKALCREPEARPEAGKPV